MENLQRSDNLSKFPDFPPHSSFFSNSLTTLVLFAFPDFSLISRTLALFEVLFICFYDLGKKWEQFIWNFIVPLWINLKFNRISSHRPLTQYVYCVYFISTFPHETAISWSMIICQYGVFGFVFNQICSLLSTAFSFLHAKQPCIQSLINTKKIEKSSFMEINFPE